MEDGDEDAVGPPRPPEGAEDAVEEQEQDVGPAPPKPKKRKASLTRALKYRRRRHCLSVKVLNPGTWIGYTLTMAFGGDSADLGV